MIVPIVLQTYNRLSYTMQVISSFKNHLIYPYYLIVIDNASSDGTRVYLDLMKSQGYIDYLILNDTNLGIATPKNQGLEVIKELAKTQEIKYICVTDNDIVFPFVRDNGKCALGKIVQLMDNQPHIGMCGVDLNPDNAPASQAWWWRLRQHPTNIPEFTEISIGFWGAVIRYEFFNDFSFDCKSLYGKCDESCRNYIYSVKKQKIGLWKGVFNGKDTVQKLGQHLGWNEDATMYPDYVAFKKQERFKAEQIWKAENKKW